MTWQMMRDDEWAFGEMVRGLIRRLLAEVYFDEEKASSWVWFTRMTVDYKSERGLEGTLVDAIAAAENSMVKLGLIARTVIEC